MLNVDVMENSFMLRMGKFIRGPITKGLKMSSTFDNCVSLVICSKTINKKSGTSRGPPKKFVSEKNMPMKC